MNALTKIRDNFAGVYRACGPKTCLQYAGATLAELPAVLKTRSLIPADKHMAGTFVWDVFGVKIELGEWYWGGARELYGRRVYFPDDRFKPKAGEVFVDLGCNLGMVSLVASKLGCRVISVEAQKFLCDFFERFMLEHNGQAELEHAFIGEGGLVDGKVDTPKITMHALLEKHGVDRVGFLKCDIEGSEFSLFTQGDVSWIDRVDRIAMEVHRVYGTPESLISVLQSRGFKTVLRHDYLFAHRADCTLM